MEMIFYSSMGKRICQTDSFTGKFETLGSNFSQETRRGFWRPNTTIQKYQFPRPSLFHKTPNITLTNIHIPKIIPNAIPQP